MISPVKKYLSLIFVIITACLPLSSEARPDSIFVGRQKHHVQGIAYDEARGRMYFSFTTSFLVTDSDGNVLGSIDKIHGHLGAMTFDPSRRKVYASLECKDDEIGSNISKGLGVEGYTESSFYIAEIDVDAVKGTGTLQDDAVRLISVPQANEDYKAEVEVDGKTYLHRYGCTGIDGITEGPGFGGEKGEFLYVAYGIKSDTLRTDNDYQILLQLEMSDIGRNDTSPARKYFIRTGNTTYGVQNLAYDSYSGKMFLSVYRGEKKQYPNYDLYAVDMCTKPVKKKLKDVPYEHKRVLTVSTCHGGWRFKYGSMGLCPLGDGFWYIAEGGKQNTCNAALYKWVPDSEKPFEPVSR